jgi:hypothetical protein
MARLRPSDTQFLLVRVVTTTGECQVDTIETWVDDVETAQPMSLCTQDLEDPSRRMSELRSDDTDQLAFPYDRKIHKG